MSVVDVNTELTKKKLLRNRNRYQNKTFPYEDNFFRRNRKDLNYRYNTTQERHLPFLVAIVGLHDCPSVCKL